MAAEHRREPDRARQFMPFASLRGYYDQIREQERVREPQRELSEDEAEELSALLSRVKRGMLVTVRYYRVDCYENVTGVVTEFDPVFRKMTLVRTAVRFDDIVSISIQDEDISANSPDI